jgi:hypothetical protein
MSANRTTFILAGVIIGGLVGFKGSDLAASYYFSEHGGVVKNGWRYSTEWGLAESPSLKAAAFAKHVMFGNSADEAVYYLATPDGSGGKKYRLHFEADQIPDVGAFWSLTMYHGELPYNLVSNSENKYVVSDRTPGIKFNDDGSLTILIQHDRPADGNIANWLPAPDGLTMLVLRTYIPGEDIRAGRYAPPPLTLAEK